MTDPGFARYNPTNLFTKLVSFITYPRIFTAIYVLRAQYLMYNKVQIPGFQCCQFRSIPYYKIS
jgi:hypothetical protein